MFIYCINVFENYNLFIEYIVCDILEQNYFLNFGRQLGYKEITVYKENLFIEYYKVFNIYCVE